MDKDEEIKHLRNENKELVKSGLHYSDMFFKESHDNYFMNKLIDDIEHCFLLYIALSLLLFKEVSYSMIVYTICVNAQIYFICNIINKLQKNNVRIFHKYNISSLVSILLTILITYIASISYNNNLIPLISLIISVTFCIVNAWDYKKIIKENNNG